MCHGTEIAAYGCERRNKRRSGERTSDSKWGCCGEWRMDVTHVPSMPCRCGSLCLLALAAVADAVFLADVVLGVPIT